MQTCREAKALKEIFLRVSVTYLIKITTITVADPIIQTNYHLAKRLEMLNKIEDSIEIQKN